MRILSTHRLHPAAEALLGSAGDYRVASALDPDTLLAEGRAADAIVVRAPLPAELFARADRLRIAARHGAGLDMIPLEAATAAGVLVSNVPGANARSVAEHVMLLALLLSRRLPAVSAHLAGGDWAGARALAETGQDLLGRRLGIVGYGAVGRVLAALAAALGIEVTVHTRRPETLAAEFAASSLDALLAGSDIVVLCCPLTPETRGLIDARRLALMGRSALLINVARGAVVDEAALLAALRSGAIGGAGLDVFETQPLPPDHPFLALPNVVLSPHMAGLTADSMAAMGVGAAEEVLRVIRGELPHNLRNPEALPRYRQRFG